MSVLVDRPKPHILRLLINRPDKRNAIDHNVRQALIETLQAVPSDGQTRAIVLGGTAGTFSAGGDLASMAGLDEQGARQRMQHIHRLCRLIEQMPVPIVAAVEGFCAGAGVGLALLCDRIVGGPSSRFLFPFMRLGLVPDWGCLRTLPARVGVAAARRMMLSEEILSAEEATHIGLLDELAEGDVLAAALEQAERMSALPQVAFMLMKRRLQQPSQSFNEELQREEEDQALLLVSPDFSEGFSAFVDKRQPVFRDHVGNQS